MLTLKIKEENYRKFVEETSRKREDWIKSISDSAVVIMERQRYLMGMSKQEFYGVFLGCPMNSRTYRKIIEKQILVPENLLLSFCFTYGYDLKRFQEVSKLIDTHDYFENYQQIGAAVECLGKEPFTSWPQPRKQSALIPASMQEDDAGRRSLRLRRRRNTMKR